MKTFKDYASGQQMELTASQRAAVQALDGFFQNDSQRCFLLKGYAGTGKTHLAGLMAHYLDAQARKNALMAPTGRAARMIARRTGCGASTIHRAIYALDKILEHERDEEDFRYYFALKKPADEEMDIVLIVDESSMVGDQASEQEFLRFGSGRLLADLLEFARVKVPGLRSRIIFIGDYAQLLPVGEKTSPALDAGYLNKHHGLDCRECELTDVVRQAADSAIYQNATRIRDTLRSGRLNRLDLQTKPGEVEDITEGHAEAIIRLCLDAQKRQILHDTLLITYSNEEALAYNRLLRSRIHPEGELAPVSKCCAPHYLTRDVLD